MLILAPRNLLTHLTALGTTELSYLMTPFDLKRLESYANNMLDYHVVLDLLPAVATLYFERRLGPDVRLSAVQSSILLALGLQRKIIEEVEVRTFVFLRFPHLIIITVRTDGTPATRCSGACTVR